MAKTSIILGGTEFSSTTNAREYVKKLLWGHATGKWLVGEERKVICDLAKRHPRAFEKIGCGIEEIRITDEGNIGDSRHFQIHRIDGTIATLSYNKCFDRKEASNMAKFISACREAISSDIVKFRRSVPLFSWISGRKLTETECHVDHSLPWPFKRFVPWFMGYYNLSADDIKFVATDKVGIYRFEDPEIRQKCRLYHDRYAILRLVSDEENQSLPRTREWGSWSKINKK